MRILFHPLLGVIDTDLFQHLNGFLPGVVFGYRLIMAGQRFHQLITDRVYRIQTCHGVLENHAHLVAAKLAHLLRGIGQQVFPFKMNGTSGNPPGILKKPDD